MMDGLLMRARANRDPLALAAGELVGAVIHAAFEVDRDQCSFSAGEPLGS